MKKPRSSHTASVSTMATPSSPVGRTRMFTGGKDTTPEIGRFIARGFGLRAAGARSTATVYSPNGGEDRAAEGREDHRREPQGAPRLPPAGDVRSGNRARRHRSEGH